MAATLFNLSKYYYNESQYKSDHGEDEDKRPIKHNKKAVRFGRLCHGNKLDANHFYLKALSRSALLTIEEEKKYGVRAQNGDVVARNIMIEANLRLVVNIARRYLYQGLPLSDLIAEGNIGLIRAVNKFKPELGYRFSTYATWWIRQMIEQAIMNQSRPFRLPEDVFKELKKMLKVKRHLLQKLHYEASAQDIAEHMNIPLAQVEKILRFDEPLVSLDNSISESLIDNGCKGQDEQLHDDLIYKSLIVCVSELPDKQRIVICRRYGLCGYEVATLAKIAQDFMVSSERVRHIQIFALKALEKLLLAKGYTLESVFN